MLAIKKLFVSLCPKGHESGKKRWENLSTLGALQRLTLQEGAHLNK